MQETLERVGELHAAVQKRIEAVGLLLADAQEHHQAADVHMQKRAQTLGGAGLDAGEQAGVFRRVQGPRILGAVGGERDGQEHGGKGGVVVHKIPPWRA